MRADLQGLKRDTDSRRSAAVTESELGSRKRRVQWIAAAAVGVIAAIVTAVFFWQSSRPTISTRVDSAGPKTIAVLPLQNINGDGTVEFLRYALADEIANALMYTRTLDVRPSAITRKFVGNDVDPQKAGREVHVANILTGHFLKQGDRLMITIEAIQVDGNKLLWQTNIAGSAQDLIALQSQILVKIRQELLPALAVGGVFPDTGMRPKNAEAYDLYLHSLALPRDAGPNKDAIAVLEHVIEIDPTYAPAWEQLGERCYYDAEYSDGGEPMFQRSNQACERSVELDPNRIAAARQLIANRVERGVLGKAYQAAQALVKRRPDSAEAHFAMAYVYRYAGMLEQATGECNEALAIDPGNYVFRSCAWAFMDLGKTARAADFVRLDAGSDWAAYIMPSLLLREGKLAEARDAVKHMPSAPRYHRDLLEACLGLRPAAELDRLAQEAETNLPSEPDAETWYYQASIFAYCGKKQAALHLLQSAVEQNYCAHENLLSDPLLAKLRTDPAFGKVLTRANTCQEAVRAEMNQISH